MNILDSFGYELGLGDKVVNLNNPMEVGIIERINRKTGQVTVLTKLNPMVHVTHDNPRSTLRVIEREALKFSEE